MRLELTWGNIHWANVFVLACGVCGAALGLAVMLGWHLHLVWLVELQPTWAPMQYNTALCFFISACALLSAALGQTRVSVVGGAFVVLVGFATALQYALSKNFGIDQLLFTHNIVVQTSSPGRMAPNTAMSFMLLGSAVGLMGYRVHRQQASSVAIMLASLTVGMALVAMAGYVTGLKPAYGWGQFTSMALHTAIGFLVLGAAVTAFHWPRTGPDGMSMNRLTGVLVSVTTLGVLLIVALAAAIGLIPFYEQIRTSLSDQVSRQLQGEVTHIQGLFTRTNDLASSLNRGDFPGGSRLAQELRNPQVQANLDLIVQKLDAWPGPGKAYLGLLQPVGAVILNRNTRGKLQLIPAQPVVSQAIARGRRGESGVTTNNKQASELAFYAPVGKTAWVVVSLVPARELYAEADQQILLIGMIVMLVALCGALGMARLLRPLTTGILVQSAELQNRVDQATRELQASVRKMEEKNAELEEFSYVVSHDLQAPLRGIDGFAALLERKHAASLNSEGREYLGFIRQGAEQMGEFIQGFLQVSRLGSRSQPMEAVDVAGIMEKLRAQFRFTLDQTDAQLCARGLPLVLGDPGQLAQLFQNLIDNAIKFRSPERALEISIDAKRKGPRWQFTLSDNGLGVDPSESEQIFKLFQRAASTDTLPGTGIGLALCAKIVQRHGGEISVQQTPGGGATFVFDLAAA